MATYRKIVVEKKEYQFAVGKVNTQIRATDKSWSDVVPNTSLNWLFGDTVEAITPKDIAKYIQNRKRG